jgi:hypothetical protein
LFKTTIPNQKDKLAREIKMNSMDAFVIETLHTIYQLTVPELISYFFPMVAILSFFIPPLFFLPWRADRKDTILMSIWIKLHQWSTFLFFLCWLILAGVFWLHGFLYQNINQFRSIVDVYFIGEWWWSLITLVLRISLAIFYARYILTWLSRVFRKFRKEQTTDTYSDIRKEFAHKTKKYDITKHYKDDSIVIGEDTNKKPVYVPMDMWRETNTQIIGPTRWGKGVLIGCIMDQIIRKGDNLIYIDPKGDDFAPAIMHQACLDTKRPFYYLSLRDDEYGQWAPFTGGIREDAFTRIKTVFELNHTGDPATDFYKTKEIEKLKTAFEKGRTIHGLQKHLKLGDQDSVQKTMAQLSEWCSIKSLNPKSKGGLSIENLLRKDSVIYVRGDLFNRTIVNATRIFIMELIMESRRLVKSRENHLTAIIDEVSFLTSDTLTGALATSLGFKLNFVLAYQSRNDLLNLKDKTMNGRYIASSTDTNCQIKAIYGGGDAEHAEWLAKQSGTINKTVTRLENTTVATSGGEHFQQGRSIGNEKEYHINPNTIQRLQPQVCVLIRPTQIPTICKTTFIPINNSNALTDFITKRNQDFNRRNNPDDKVEAEVIEANEMGKEKSVQEGSVEYKSDIKNKGAPKKLSNAKIKLLDQLIKDEVGVDEICRELDISKTTYYRHKKNKSKHKV